MKILSILGASGATGQILTKQALEQGLKVRALCRKKESLPLLHEHLSITEGRITVENCKAVIRGSDAVVCVLGQRKGDSKPFCADATRLILQAMTEEGVKRLLCVTGAMVGEYNAAQRSWFIRQMVAAFRKQMPAMAQDRALQERIIADSMLDWTILKPPRLTNGIAKGSYRIGEGVRVSAFSAISRADVAGCLLRSIGDSSTLRKFLVIKN